LSGQNAFHVAQETKRINETAVNPATSVYTSNKYQNGRYVKYSSNILGGKVSIFSSWSPVPSRSNPSSIAKVKTKMTTEEDEATISEISEFTTRAPLLEQLELEKDKFELIVVGGLFV
jgi:hypothetical protein